jgi:predicted 3-demethylubiquinone-9 3-methyltransferase (glyoxalase superfamily)
MPEIAPCLWFDTEAEDAAAFYTSVFPNGRVLEVTHYGKGGPRPEGMVLTVSFQLDGRPFTALNGGPEFTFNEAVSFEVHCTSQDEVDYYWRNLSEDGEEGPCGWLKDKFGVSWQVVPDRLIELISDPDPERSERVVRAMMQMQKIDIAALEEAANASHMVP